jgi:hypothetical protein
MREDGGSRREVRLKAVGMFVLVIVGQQGLAWRSAILVSRQPGDFQLLRILKTSKS